MAIGADPRGHDPRMAAVGAAAWLAGVAAHLLDGRQGWLLVPLVVTVVLSRWSPPTIGRLVAAAALVAAAVVVSTLLRREAVTTGPVADLAARRATAEIRGTVTSDPRPLAGRWGEQQIVRVRVHEVSARGLRYRLGATVLVLGDAAWRDARLGEDVRFSTRLAPADDPELAALAPGARAPVRIRGPDVWWRAAARVRAAIRASVADRPSAQRQLVPALVVGDDAGMDPDLAADFRTTGLTHLTAVSGTNLTLILGFVLLLARGLGVRGRWLHLVGLLGVVGFVLLARTEPSVVRAAVMGLVGLFAFGTDGRRRGLRALGVAVTALVLVSPSLAVSAGFALSVLATGGIVLLGPPLEAALRRWLPAPAAQAIAVPTAAQIACTPLVAALSGQVSLVAVAANLLVGPAVGPATVLGLAGGVVGLLLPGVGAWFGTLAAWCVAWIVLVARRGADLPAAAIDWGSGGVHLGLLAVLCVVLLALAPRLLRSRWTAAGIGLVLVLIVLDVPGRALPWGGAWPPRDWVLVACDVGQGDALAVATGRHSAVVVDAGPDPDAVDECLDDLEVEVVPLVVLTHFHADHVDGLSGVLSGRRVGAIESSAMLDPVAGARQADRDAARSGISIRRAPYAASRRIGAVTLQVLAPDLPEPVLGPGDGSAANDASVVLLVESRGLRLLLTGDVEPTGQARLAAALPGLDVDVLKVPHHGSAHQDRAWLGSLDAEVAVISVGADNDYGHPAADLIADLEGGGTTVARTDRGGDLAVTVGPDGAPRVVTRRR